jgi:hypothetical protein
MLACRTSQQTSQPKMPRIRTAFLLPVTCAVLVGCAATDGSGGGADPWADSGSRPARSDDQAASPASTPPAANDPRDAVEATKPSGKVEWVAVFESPPEARYNEQRVIYVDRNSVEPHRLENLTYYLARTREVSRSGAKPKIQELAVLCEGAPVAPATALRGEGTEDGGTYSLKRAATPLTSVSQFSTQRLRPDASNPNTFIVRAVCVLGTGG